MKRHDLLCHYVALGRRVVWNALVGMTTLMPAIVSQGAQVCAVDGLAGFPQQQSGNTPGFMELPDFGSRPPRTLPLVLAGIRYGS